jgi:hypothetical protein
VNTVAIGQGAIAAGTANYGNGVYMGFSAGGSSAASRTGSIAIGQQTAQAGQGENAIAIGYFTPTQFQAANSIVIDTQAAVGTTTANACYINPIRNGGSAGLPASCFNLAYNPTTYEVVYYS